MPSSAPSASQERRRRKSRSRGRRKKVQRPNGEEDDANAADLYAIEILAGRHQAALPVYDVVLPEEEGTEASGGGRSPRSVPHVCARQGEGYAIRVRNKSARHIACSVAVDGENTLLRDGSLIVAPGDSRELPGYLVSKNFVGREYVKEYRDFRFGKPNVVEVPVSAGAAAAAAAARQAYISYGVVTCDVYEAELDEEVDSDQELRGQSTFYRGAGLNGSFEERQIPEGKKSHLLYSSVTVQGPRSSISNTTRGRWWIRGQRKLRSLEVRYREAHSLMLLGVDARELGLVSTKEEDDEGRAKKEDWDAKDEKEEKLEDLHRDGLRPQGHVELCDLTVDDESEGAGRWSVQEAPRRAEPVDVVA